MRYLIHAHKSRAWYVNGYLVPELRKQGIEPDIYMDNGGEGNLYATMNSFLYCGDAWHLQDDVCICHDFAERTKAPETITCGFCRLDMSVPDTSGKQEADKMWFSFPCIYIPGHIARGCAKWFFTEGSRTEDKDLKRLIELRKGDDSFFREYIDTHYPDIEVMNLKPNLVDHVDYMIGGSIANRRIGHNIGAISAYYEDTKDGLEEWLSKLNM